MSGCTSNINIESKNSTNTTDNVSTPMNPDKTESLVIARNFIKIIDIWINCWIHHYSMVRLSFRSEFKRRSNFCLKKVSNLIWDLIFIDGHGTVAITEDLLADVIAMIAIVEQRRSPVTT